MVYILDSLFQTLLFFLLTLFIYQVIFLVKDSHFFQFCRILQIRLSNKTFIDFTKQINYKMTLRRSRSPKNFTSLTKFKIRQLCSDQSSPKLIRKFQSSKQHKKPNYSQKQTKNSGFYHNLVPININSEKLFFYQHRFKYNPLFLYTTNKQAKQQLANFIKCDNLYLQQALFILQKSNQLNYCAQIQSLSKITVQQIKKQIESYIRGLQIKEQIQYQFNQNLLPSMSIVYFRNSYNFEQTCKLMVALPIMYNQITFEGALNHQLGTHYLRKYNQKQNWQFMKKQYKCSDDFLDTQEGLAAINQLLPYLKQDNKIPPLLYNASLLYYSCYLASKYTFQEQFQILSKYQQNPQLNWKYCIRSRRGIRDTSKKGGMYKDQVYLRGAIKILRNRKHINFQNLYSGKIGLKDCHLLQKSGIINKNIKMPSFLKNNQYYISKLDYIAQFNNI